MTLISPTDHFAVAGALILIVVFGLWAENTRFGKTLTGALIIIITALGLSNLNILPHEAPAYGLIVSFMVPAAIPLLLFKANLRQIFRATSSMLGAFAVATVGTVLGTLVAFNFAGLESIGVELAAMFTAGFIGGGVNFVAVAEALGFDDPSRYAAALAADTLVTVLFIVVLAALPAVSLVRRVYHSRFSLSGAPGASSDAAAEVGSEFRLADALFALGVSLALAAIAYGVAGMIGREGFGIIFLTVLALAVANIFHDRCAALRGEFELGMVFMYLFFAVIGASANILELISSAGPIFLFVLIIIGTHLVFLLLVAYFLKLDFAEVLIASNACVLGPPVAAAMAANRGWHALVTPGILCGILGYAIGTFIGVGLAQLL